MTSRWTTCNDKTTERSWTERLLRKKRVCQPTTCSTRLLEPTTRSLLMTHRGNQHARIPRLAFMTRREAGRWSAKSSLSISLPCSARDSSMACVIAKCSAVRWCFRVCWFVSVWECFKFSQASSSQACCCHHLEASSTTRTASTSKTPSHFPHELQLHSKSKQ